MAKWKSFEDRFWENVKRGNPDECWMWTGSNQRKGYGSITMNGVRQTAHRASYMQHHGVILSSDEVVGHSCNRAGCVNPAHLYLTTNAGNVKDAFRDGLHPKQRTCRGESHQHSRLREGQVIDIKKKLSSGGRLTIIAREYSVNANTIRNIRDGKSWRGVMP